MSNIWVSAFVCRQPLRRSYVFRHGCLAGSDCTDDGNSYSQQCIAPTAFQKWFHPEGVIGTALGAAAKNALMILAEGTGTPLEAVHKAVPNGHRWMQVYMVKPRNDMLRHIRRVEAAGYQAIVLTIDDVPSRRISYSSLRGEFEFPASIDFVNLPRPVIGGTIADSVHQINTVTWDDVDWLKNVTRLPIILKGILTPEDAEIAVRHGVDGVYVSNHGGRTLDGTTASINALWDVVRAVRGRCEVYLDGGIRNGRDVYTALALGAKAVFIGRPAIYGLATNGSQGVQDVIEILTNELESTMALTGVTRVCDISPSYVVKQSYYETLNRPPCRQFSSKQLSVNFVG
ncbi:hydroxyacid oxidase 2-like [Lingula anatina]|uniref:Hydroxyacid oxidase 2-like n=1 Tax=Lingula anatina TaxID=7574 RepID=A0A1S3IKY5_LINAN|nr:hydroxyacid oxidase 2-like [Lingula anatina]|eukprot:XP_013398748.1 hydroxyacid oxidase 2-like [Lingula anatina]